MANTWQGEFPHQNLGEEPFPYRGLTPQNQTEVHAAFAKASLVHDSRRPFADPML
jgi:hypothetical protein